MQRVERCNNTSGLMDCKNSSVMERMGGCGNLRYSSSLRDAIYHRQCANARMLAGPGSVAKKRKSWKPWILKGSPSRKKKKKRPVSPTGPSMLSHTAGQSRQKARGPFSAVGWSVHSPSSSPVSVPFFWHRSALRVRCAAVQCSSAVRSSLSLVPSRVGPLSLPFPLLSFKLFLSLFDHGFRVTHSSFRPASTETPVGLVALALEFPNPTNSTPALSSRRALSSRNPVPIVTRLETRRDPSPSLSCQAILACLPSVAHRLS